MQCYKPLVTMVRCYRYVYITTTSNGRIIRASLRSQDVNQFDVLVTNLSMPTQIVIDFYTGLLFFNDISLHVIMSVNYDGSNLTVVLGPQHVYMPQCLAVFEDEVFYCENISHQLYHANKFGRSSPYQLPGNSSTVTLVHPLLQPAADPYERQRKLALLVCPTFLLEYINSVCCIREFAVLSVSQPCSGNPCGVGLCLPVNSTSHRCMCLDGYKLDYTKGCVIDPCHGEPCGVGVCLPAGESYSCDCPRGYLSDGNQCNIAIAIQQSNKKGI